MEFNATFNNISVISEITKVCLTLPDIQSGRFPFHQTEQNFTGPKKYQALPAVVAFNEGLPTFHFSY
jgi:hypothetical protein